ncbi:MAG: potassium channel protein [Elusimicrobia bacterium]|nr:potassium channel protein [Elusimicrobiota bacterium]
MKKFTIIFFIAVTIIATGTAGYMLIEKWNFLDALYMTFITLSSIGYGEVHPLSVQGQIFTIVLIVIGFSVLAGLMGYFSSLILAGEIGIIMRRRKMKESIKKLSNHHIICGLSPVGEAILEEFLKTKQKFVVVEKDEVKFEMAQKNYGEFLYILGDATQDEVLIEAGIQRAKSILICLNEDSHSLYVVISAKSLNPKIKILVSVVEEDAFAKMKRAGADYVISPQKIGGLRMASTVLRPNVVSFLDIMLKESEGEWRIEEVEVPEKSPFLNKTLAESQISKNTGLVVIAMRKAKTGRFVYNPDASMRLEAKDKILVLGNQELLSRLITYLKQGV